jgi:hypothetical protein
MKRLILPRRRALALSGGMLMGGADEKRLAPVIKASGAKVD